jgi:uncharacterized membrane protein YhaH (DUF805 family)
MGPAQAITTCLAKSFQFSGRASRSEFWWFTLLSIAVTLALLFAIDVNLLGLDLASDWLYAPVSDTFGLLMLPATVSVTARRLQDRGLPGWPAALCLAAVYAITFIPTVMETTRYDGPLFVLAAANLVVLILALLPSTPGPNRYGSPPAGATP